MEIYTNLINGKYDLVMFIIIFILLFNLYYKNNIEYLTDTGLSTEIKKVVTEVYLADVESIRNLSDITNKLVKGDFSIPGNLKVSGNIEAGGATKCTGTVNIDNTITVKGISTLQNVNVLGPTTFNSAVDFKNTLNYLPKGVIIAWNSAVAPVGWALCDGKNGTPNLQGLFILGSNTYRSIGIIGGVETVTLTADQIPPHSHTLLLNNACFNNGGCDSRASVDGTNTANTGFNTLPNYQPQTTGGGQSHENMPPFYTLTYIIKL
jgi:microcystin-dependent protein